MIPSLFYILFYVCLAILRSFNPEILLIIDYFGLILTKMFRSTETFGVSQLEQFGLFS